MRRKRWRAGAILGVLCLVLVILLARRWAVTPETTERFPETEPGSAESTVIAELDTPDTPAAAAVPTPSGGADHEHRWDGETGTCLVCGWACPHERHDPETTVCLRCGLQCRHHFGAAGVCSGCGTEAPLYTEDLPERYFAPARNEGRVRHDTVTEENGVEHKIAVWLPYDYDANGKYNLVLLIHGDNGSLDDWMDKEKETPRGKIKLCWIYDHLTEEKLCRPFIVVSMENARMDDPAYGERLLEEILLPYLARNYATYAEGGSHEKLAAAREHIAIGGMSRGSIYTYSVGMDRCFDVAANFCCFSNGYQTTLPNRLSDEEYGELPMRCYVATVGTDDNPNYVSAHTRQYQLLCDEVERIRDGENARFLEIAGGHEYLVWYTSIYDALLLMF